MMTNTKFEPLEDWLFTYLNHELRTPLNALLGFSQMLSNGAYGELNPRQQDRMDRVLHSANLLLRRLDLLLDYNRLHQGNLDLTGESVSIFDLLEEALSGIDYDNRGRPLQVVFPDNMPDALLATNQLWAGVAVREVLLHAASEAMPDPTIWLDAVVNDRSGDVALKVRFNAAPMDNWQQGNLFTIHNRTGIGLPLAMELLSRMSGRIEYESYATRHEIYLHFPLS